MPEDGRWLPTIEDVGLREIKQLTSQSEDNVYELEIPGSQDDQAEPFVFSLACYSGKSATLNVSKAHPDKSLVSGITFKPFCTGRIIRASGWIKKSDGEEVVRYPLVLEEDSLLGISTGRKADSGLSPQQTALLKALLLNPYGHVPVFQNWTEFPLALYEQSLESKLRPAVLADIRAQQDEEKKASKKPPYEWGRSPLTDIINDIWQKTQRGNSRQPIHVDRIKSMHVQLGQLDNDDNDNDDDEEEDKDTDRKVSPIRMFGISYIYHPQDKVGDFTILTKVKRINAKILDRDDISITYMFQEDDLIVKIEGLGIRVVKPFEKIVRELQPQLQLPDNPTLDDIASQIAQLKDVLHNPEANLPFLDDTMDRVHQLLSARLSP